MQYALISAIKAFIDLLEILIIVDALLSFINPPKNNSITRIIRTIIDPIIVPCFRLQQSIAPNLQIDFSPMIAILFLDIIKRLILNILL